MRDERQVQVRRDALVAMSRDDPFAKVLSVSLTFEREKAICRMPYSAEFAHAAGGTHGGIFGLLLDTVGWCVLTPHYDALLTTVEYHTRLLDDAKREYLVATGEVVRLGRSIAVANMSVRSVSGNMIAIGSGTYAATGKAFWQ